MSKEGDTFSGVKSLLQKSKQVGAIKVDLFTHITEIVNRIISSHKYDAYQKFEEVSMLIKKTQLNIKNPKHIDQIQELNVEEVQSELDRYIEEVRGLLNNKLTVSDSDKKFVSKDGS